MKKYIKRVSVTGIIIIMSLPESAHTAVQYKDPDVMFQTWEEFLKNGVQIEYDNTATNIDSPGF